ncbi:hypothetical protein Syun_007829 [Stephania yunnanensis]|uniref:Uncharacterized protein n=1 Tax=Stephania yunnanensis TaxID=152371 RepID=A0AAP0KZ78_9MAGN
MELWISRQAMKRWLVSLGMEKDCSDSLFKTSPNISNLDHLVWDIQGVPQQRRDVSIRAAPNYHLYSPAEVEVVITRL